jgi:hypothetical protein
MAEDRARRVARILEVQKQLYAREEWRLTELQRRLGDLDRDQRELIGALNEDAALQGLFLDAMARRLRSLADEWARVEREREAQAHAVRSAGARVGTAQRLFDRVTREAARAREQHALAETLDRLPILPG